MYCCIDCFADEEIRNIIHSANIKDTCDFCGTHNTYVYDIDKNPAIPELFEPLLEIYTPISELPLDFPREQTGLMKDILHSNWQIFNCSPSVIYKLIKVLCANRYKEQSELFDYPIGIKESQDHSFFEENSILKGHQWNEFVTGIKTKNRFHSNYINTGKLYTFLQCVVGTYSRSSEMYRARICPEKGFPSSEMGAPPNYIAKAGRVNPDGISVLYLSGLEETTLREVRAGLHDFVTIGKFELQQDIKIVKLTEIDHISPFLNALYGFSLTDYVINLPHLKTIAREIAEPLQNGNVLDYLPTQYICDFIHSKGYDGIEYNSTMHKGGINLAVFDSNVFKCTETKVCKITSINYEHKLV